MSRRVAIFQIDFIESEWEFPTTMKTLTVDAHKRIRIPEAKPRQVFAYESNGKGSFTLTVVRATEKKQAFPRGSLLKYITPAYNRHLSALAKGTLRGPSKQK